MGKCEARTGHPAGNSSRSGPLSLILQVPVQIRGSTTAEKSKQKASKTQNGSKLKSSIATSTYYATVTPGQEKAQSVIEERIFLGKMHISCAGAMHIGEHQVRLLNARVAT